MSKKWKNAEPCEHCGHCPTCGRGGVVVAPINPWYPYMPYQPYPYISVPTVWCGTATVSGSVTTTGAGFSSAGITYTA